MRCPQRPGGRSPDMSVRSPEEPSRPVREWRMFEVQLARKIARRSAPHRESETKRERGADLAADDPGVRHRHEDASGLEPEAVEVERGLYADADVLVETGERV